jgi:hypothetical protein
MDEPTWSYNVADIIPRNTVANSDQDDASPAEWNRYFSQRVLKRIFNLYRS